MNVQGQSKIILVLAAIVLVSFSAGFISGYSKKQVKMGQRFDPAQWNVYAMKTLRQKLDLSSEQQERIQAVIDQTVEEMKAVHADTVQQTAEIVDRLLAAVDKELTPEQRKIAATLSPSEDEVTIDLLKVAPESK